MQTTVRRLVSAWTLLAGVYFLWEALAYRGIFARLAELQFERFGAYAPLLTYLWLVGFAVAPALLLAWLARPKAPAAEEQAASIEFRLHQAKRIRSILNVVAGIAVAVAIGFVVFASAFLPGQSGKLQTIAASEIGSVDVSEGPARLVGGELGTIVFFGHDWYISDRRMAFAPYRQVGGEAGVSRLFVELDARDPKALARVQQAPAWSGIIVQRGLPGAARVLFSSIGVGIGEPYYTLYRSEAALKVGYWLQAAQWLMLGVFVGLLSLLQKRRIKRLEDLRSSPLT